MDEEKVHHHNSVWEHVFQQDDGKHLDAPPTDDNNDNIVWQYLALGQA